MRPVASRSNAGQDPALRRGHTTGHVTRDTNKEVEMMLNDDNNDNMKTKPCESF